MICTFQIDNDILINNFILMMPKISTNNQNNQNISSFDQTQKLDHGHYEIKDLNGNWSFIGFTLVIYDNEILYPKVILPTFYENILNHDKLNKFSHVIGNIMLEKAIKAKDHLQKAEKLKIYFRLKMIFGKNGLYPKSDHKLLYDLKNEINIYKSIKNHLIIENTIIKTGSSIIINFFGWYFVFKCINITSEDDIINYAGQCFKVCSKTHIIINLFDIKNSLTMPRFYNSLNLSKNIVKTTLLSTLFNFSSHSDKNNNDQEHYWASRYLKNEGLAKLRQILWLFRSNNSIIEELFPRIVCVYYYEDHEYAFDFIKRYISKLYYDNTQCQHQSPKIYYLNIANHFESLIYQSNSLDYETFTNNVKSKLMNIFSEIYKISNPEIQMVICLDFSTKYSVNIIETLINILIDLKNTQYGKICYILFKPIKKEDKLHSNTNDKAKDSQNSTLMTLIDFDIETLKKDILKIKLLDYGIYDTSKNTLMNIQQINEWIMAIKKIKMI